MKPSENVSSFIQMVVLQYLLIKNVNFLNFIISTDKSFPLNSPKKTNKQTNKQAGPAVHTQHVSSRFPLYCPSFTSPPAAVNFPRVMGHQ